jgi:hypothetical protein
MKDMMSFSLEKMMSRMFRRVNDVLWDLMTGKLGVRTSDGEIATLVGTGDDATISLNPVDNFGVPIPAFAQNTPVDAVKPGDLVYTGSEKPGWVVDRKTDGNKSFRIIRPGGSVSNWVPPKIEMFGLDGGVLVVRSLLNVLPEDSGGGLKGFQSNLLPLLALGGNDIDLETIMPLMLMGQLGGGAGGNNMLHTIMMMKMLGGSTLLGSRDSDAPSTSTRKPFKF